MKREGFRLTELNPTCDGLISIDQVLDAFEDDTFLVSIMTANNEIGVLQPIEKIADLCRSNGVIFHTDAAQAFGHIPLDIGNIGLDLVSLSSHKLYGPKGIGALIINKEVPIIPLQWGGGQEYGLRPGTIPVPLLIGFAKAVEIAMSDMKTRQKKICYLRNYFWDSLQKEIPHLILNGSMKTRLPNNINFTVKHVRGSQLHKELKPLILCSSGSACSNGAPSHVLKALGRTISESQASLRLSFGRHTSINEVDKAIIILSEIIRKLRVN